MNIRVLPYRWDLYKTYLRGGLVGAEIGVAQGQNAVNMWQFAKPKKLHLVDIWQDEGKVIEWAGSVERPSTRDRALFRDTFKSYKEYVEDAFHEEVLAGRVECHRATGEKWLAEQEDKSLDFIYTDATKQYDEMQEFISQALRVVKKGGYFCGHDWNNAAHFRNLVNTVHVPILDKIQEGKLTLVAISNDFNLPPSFVCRVNK